MGSTALYRALHDPTLYPEPTSTVEVRETPMSMVFLTDDYVYKIKKPVNSGLLDFSTLDRRRFYCDQELELNRRLSTGVYCKVVPIYREGQHYRFQGDSPAVEYALKMRRLQDGDCLQTRLRQGRLSSALIDTLAERLATFHATHPLPLASEQYGSLDQVRTGWRETFAPTTDHSGQSVSTQAYTRIRKAVTAFLGEHADWFSERLQAGRIRHCHGDLRAEHIYLEAGQIQVIDCIEFNQRLRFIDVASEVALLVIDLECLGASELAYDFVEAYVKHSGDVSLYRLLDLYLCYRAYVQGKSADMRRHQAETPQAREQLQQLAETCFALAERYAMRLTRPLLVAMTGSPGRERSMVAAGVAAALDLRLCSADQLRQERLTLSPQMPQREPYGSGLYNLEAMQCPSNMLADAARTALEHGHAVMLDAAFLSPDERQRLAALAQQTAAASYLLECVVPAEPLGHLQQHDNGSEGPSEALRKRLGLFLPADEPVHTSDTECRVRLDVTQGVDACVQQALASMARQRP